MSKSIFNTAIFNSKNITNSNSVNAVTTDLIIAENLEVTGTLTNAEVQTNSLKVGITNAQSNAITTNTNKVGISTSQTSAITSNTLKLSAITYNTTDDVTEFSESIKIDSDKNLFIGSKNIGSSLTTVENSLGDKQDTLTDALNAGDNISITSDGVISSSHTNTNTTYTAKSEGGLALSGTEFSLDLTNIASDSTYAFPRDVFVDSSKKLRAGALEYYKSSAVKDVSTEFDKKADLFVIDSASSNQLAFSTDTDGAGVAYKTLEVTLASGITNSDYGLVTSDVVFDSIKTKADDFIVNPSNTTSQMRFTNYTDTGTGAVSKSLQLIMASSIANSNYGLVTSDQVFDGLALKEDSFVVNSASSNQLEFVNEGSAKTLKVKLATAITDADGGLVTSDLAQSKLVTIGTNGTNDNQTIYGNKTFDDILEYNPRIMRFYYAIESVGNDHVRSGSNNGVWGNGSYLTSVAIVTNNTSFAENTATANDRSIKLTADGYYRIRVSVNYFSPIVDGRMSLRVYLYNRSTGTSYSTNRAYNFFALGSTSLRACVGTSLVFEDYAGFTSGTQLQVRHDLNTSTGGNGRGYSDTFSSDDTDKILMYQNVTIEKIR